MDFWSLKSSVECVLIQLAMTFAMDVIQQLHWVHIFFCDFFPSSPSEGITASSTLKIFPTARDVDSTL